MSNNKTRCPRCSSIARYVEGKMKVQSGGIEMIAGPQWSIDLINELRMALVNVIDDPPVDPIAPVEAIAPELGGRLRRVTKGWSRADVLTLIGALVAVLMYFNVTPTDIQNTAEAAWSQITELLNDVQDHGPSGIPSPTPPPPTGPE